MLEERANQILKKHEGEDVWKVKSFSRPDEFHIVWKKNDKWDCTCEAKAFKPSRTCDHIRKVRHQKMKWHGHSKKKKNKV